MFIHPLLPRVTQSGYDPTSCSLLPKPTQSAMSGDRRRRRTLCCRGTCTESEAVLLLRCLPPLSYSSRLQKLKARVGESHMSHLSTLPACLHLHSVTLTEDMCGLQGGLHPQVVDQAALCHSRGHSSGAIRGQGSVSLQNVHVHTHIHTQRRMATGPDGDRVLFPGLKRLIWPPCATESLMPSSLILYLASRTSDPMCTACSKVPTPHVSADCIGSPSRRSQLPPKHH